MIEEMLIQYGALGAMMLYMMYDKQVLQRKMMQTIDNNTLALGQIKISLERCKLHDEVRR